MSHGSPVRVSSVAFSTIEVYALEESELLLLLPVKAENIFGLGQKAWRCSHSEGAEEMRSKALECMVYKCSVPDPKR